MNGDGAVVDLLDRPVYFTTDVDRILDLTPSTARRWIDGYTRNGISYDPVIRTHRTGDEAVTWGEFVECRMLAEYRDQDGIRIPKLRQYIARLRDRFGTRYPLAHAAPLLTVHGREIVLEVDRELQADDPAGQGPVFFERLDSSRQEGFSAPMHRFIRAVEFGLKPAAGGDRIVNALRPQANLSAVMVEPDRQFGSPQVRGIPTAALAELYRAGDPLDQLAEWYDLSEPEILQALTFEGVAAA